MRIILASKSPRRRDILSEYAAKRDFSFEIITMPTDEELFDIHPRDGVVELAIRKGAAVAERYSDALIISSDTLVELEGEALGKPRDEDEAKNMLTALSGRAHNVHTGRAVHYNGRVFSGVASTAVYFKELSPRQIDDYIRTGEPMDKAGAYGIQGYAGAFVEKYIGEFDTVVGFNMTLLISLLKEACPGGEW